MKSRFGWMLVPLLVASSNAVAAEPPDITGDYQRIVADYQRIVAATDNATARAA